MPSAAGITFAWTCVNAETLFAEGQSIEYWQADNPTETFFRFSMTGYENTYRLDCRNRRFLWVQNRDLSSGRITDNNAGAEWRDMNPNSKITNAVYAKTCPDLLARANSKSIPKNPQDFPADDYLDGGLVNIDGWFGLGDSANVICQFHLRQSYQGRFVGSSLAVWNSDYFLSLGNSVGDICWDGSWDIETLTLTGRHISRIDVSGPEYGSIRWGNQKSIVFKPIIHNNQVLPGMLVGSSTGCAAMWMDQPGQPCARSRTSRTYIVRDYEVAQGIVQEIANARVQQQKEALEFMGKLFRGLIQK